MTKRISWMHTLAAAAAILAAPSAHALAVAPTFSGAYSVLSLGSVTGLPPNYGGLTFLDNDTLLIGGSANNASGRLYTVGVARNASNQITGFSGSATLYGAVGEYNDGGVVFGPGGVLFTSRWPVNGLGQTRPGNTDEDKIIDLGALGVASSNSAINFVPAGFGGAGKIKLVSYGGGQWYSASLVPDGGGTYDLSGLTQVDVDSSTAGTQNLPGGPEGFVYIAAGNPGFGVNSLLLSEYNAGVVSAYEVDADGNPLLATRRVFLTDLTGAEGAAIDPLTGDFLFSTFGGGSQVAVVRGFNAPPPPDNGAVPAPGSHALFLLGLALAALAAPRRGQQKHTA